MVGDDIGVRLCDNARRGARRSTPTSTSTRPARPGSITSIRRPRDDALRHRRRRARLPVAELGNGPQARRRSTCNTRVSPASSATRRERIRAGLAPESRYDDDLPRDYWDASARADRLAEMGVDEAVVFPNFGLLWERTLDENLGALTANMTAWNRWCAIGCRRRSWSCASGRARDAARRASGSSRELARLERAGVHLAMVAPALVDGRPLSHTDHDPIWRAFVEHGVTPVFHVADQRRVFDDVWYTEPDDGGLPPLESDLLVDRGRARVHRPHPERHARTPSRVCASASSSCRAVWVPMFLMMLDGGTEFTTRLNGRPRVPAADEAERVLPPPGSRVVVLVRAARPPHPPDRRPLHVLLRLPALRGDGDAARRLHRCGEPVGPVDAPGLFGDNVTMLLERS